MTDKTITISREIGAPIDRVWQCWTNQYYLKHWFTAFDGTEPEIFQFDLKVGGKVRLKFPGAPGEYTWTFVEIDKPTKLVIDILDFSFEQFQPDGVGGITNIKLEDLGGKTRLTISGELPDEMDNDKMRQMAEKGWGGTLDRLNKYLKEN